MGSKHCRMRLLLRRISTVQRTSAWCRADVTRIPALRPWPRGGRSRVPRFTGSLLGEANGYSEKAQVVSRHFACVVFAP